MTTEARLAAAMEYITALEAAGHELYQSCAEGTWFDRLTREPLAGWNAVRARKPPILLAPANPEPSEVPGSSKLVVERPCSLNDRNDLTSGNTGSSPNRGSA